MIFVQGILAYIKSDYLAEIPLPTLKFLLVRLCIKYFAFIYRIH